MLCRFPDEPGWHGIFPARRLCRLRQRESGGVMGSPISLTMAENEARFVPDVCGGGAVQQELKFA